LRGPRRGRETAFPTGGPARIPARRHSRGRRAFLSRRAGAWVSRATHRRTLGDRTMTAGESRTPAPDGGHISSRASSPAAPGSPAGPAAAAAGPARGRHRRRHAIAR